MLYGFQGVRKRKKIGRFVLGIFLVLLIAWVFEGVWGQYKKNRLVNEAHTEAQEELTALLERKHELKEDLDRLGSERGIEEELRTKFHIAKPGEKTVIIVDSKEENIQEKEDGVWWSFFTNLFE